MLEIRQFPDGLPATATIVVAKVPTTTVSVTVDGVILTYDTHFFGATIGEVVQSLTAAINGDVARYGHVHTQTQPVKRVYAVYYGSTIRLIATVPGLLGNSIEVSTTGSANFTLSGATLSGGSSSVVAAISSETTPIIKTVAVAATPEVLGASTIKFISVTFIGYKAARTINTGQVWIQSVATDGAAGFPIPAGGSVNYTAPYGTYLDASMFYIDVETNGDGVVALLLNGRV